MGEMGSLQIAHESKTNLWQQWVPQMPMRGFGVGSRPARSDLDEARASLEARCQRRSFVASEVIGGIRLMFKKDDQAQTLLRMSTNWFGEVLTLIRGGGKWEIKKRIGSHRIIRRTPTKSRPIEVQLQQVILNLTRNGR